MPDFLTTREVADLLRIKERKVYDLAASGSIPHSKAMGKLLFPRASLEAWIAQGSAGGTDNNKSTRPVVFLGSHDPLLDWALRESQCGIATWFDGSADGLDRFTQGEGLATGLHLYDPSSKRWNTPLITERFAHSGAVLVKWAVRQRGLIVSPDPGHKIRSMGSLKGVKVAPRQALSGAQDLFEHLLEQASLSLDDLELITPVRTEVDAAVAVLDGQAQATFGLASLAKQYRLPFVPIINEQFDLLVERHAWFEPPMQTFLAFCRTPDFADRAEHLTGYDISELGTVRFNSR